MFDSELAWAGLALVSGGSIYWVVMTYCRYLYFRD